MMSEWIKLNEWHKPMHVRGIKLNYFILDRIFYNKSWASDPSYVCENINKVFPFWDPSWEIISIRNMPGYAAICLVVSNKEFDPLDDDSSQIPFYSFEINEGENNFKWVRVP